MRDRWVPAVAAGLAVVAIALYLVIYLPLGNQLKTKRLECLALEGEAARARKNMPVLAGRAEKPVLVAERDIPRVIEELTRGGKQKGISFISLTPGAPAKREDFPFRTLTVEMEVSASYQAWGEFLGSLDEMESGLAIVQSFRVASDERSASKVQSQLAVELFLAD